MSRQSTGQHDNQAMIAQMSAELLGAGVRRGGALLVHSSLRSLGPLAGGAESVIQALLTALGAQGALLMPALSYAHVTPEQPLFDVRHTPSNVGALAEAFRVRPGTRRSLHPTHSVCGMGRQVELLLDQHGKDATPCGSHSPFRLLAESGGQLLMLGCGLRPNTSMHGIEELVEPPYLFGRFVDYGLVDWGGQTTKKRYRVHGFAGWEQRYDRVAEILAEPDLRTGRVLQAEVFVIEAKALWSAAEAMLRRNPLYFVDSVEQF